VLIEDQLDQMPPLIEAYDEIECNHEPHGSIWQRRYSYTFKALLCLYANVSLPLPPLQASHKKLLDIFVDDVLVVVFFPF